MDHREQPEIDTRDIPDSITPLIGVRGWMFLDDGLLHSISYDLQGWGTEKKQALCACISNAIKRDLPYWMHAAPHEFCTCGIYAGRDRAAIEDQLLSRHKVPYGLTIFSESSRINVIGTVELSGKVLLYDKGYRAEYAKIHSFTEILVDIGWALNPVDYMVQRVQRVMAAYPSIPLPQVLPIQGWGMDADILPDEDPLILQPPIDQTVRCRIDLGLLHGEMEMQGRNWNWRPVPNPSLPRFHDSDWVLWIPDGAGNFLKHDLLYELVFCFQDYTCAIPLLSLSPESWWEDFLKYPDYWKPGPGGNVFHWSGGRHHRELHPNYRYKNSYEWGGHCVQFGEIYWSHPDREFGGEGTFASNYRAGAWSAAGGAGTAEYGGIHWRFDADRQEYKDQPIVYSMIYTFGSPPTLKQLAHASLVRSSHTVD